MSWRRRPHLERAEPPRRCSAVRVSRAPAYLSPGPAAERWPVNSLWRRKLNRHILKPTAEPEPFAYNWPTTSSDRYGGAERGVTISGAVTYRGWDYDATHYTHTNATQYA